MRDVILNQADQITKALEVNQDVRVTESSDAILFTGMGGSGHPGDLLNALHVPTVPLTVHRDYDLPVIHGSKPLVVVSSYSGNTEESLSGYTAAQAAGYPILVNTSGGKAAEWSQRDGVPLVKIDFPGMQPRHTLLASFVGMATALANSGLAKDVSADLRRVAGVLDRTIPALEEPAQELARSLKGVTPVFTASTALGFAAKNCKIQTNENVKVPAFWNEFPELNHNEMVGFSEMKRALGGTSPFRVVMLRDDSDHPRNRARMQVTQELYEQWGVPVSTFDVVGTTLLEKIFYAVSFGLWTTYFLAKEYGIDPVPVDGVENFKKRLAEVAGPL